MNVIYFVVILIWYFAHILIVTTILHVNNPNARDKLIEIVDQYSLVDPLTELFPDLQRYTWRKKDTF